MNKVIEVQKAIAVRANQLKGIPALAFVGVFMQRQLDRIKQIEDTWVNAAPETWGKMAAEKKARLSVLKEYEQAAKDQARKELESEK